MNKLFLIVGMLFLLISCESREDKIQKAVSQELKGVVYDFERYEPVKTQIDSAFFSPYIDPEIKSLMMALAKPAKELETAKRDYNNALSSIAFWDCGSAYSRQQRKEAISKRDAAKNKIKNIQTQLKSAIKNLYTQVHKDETKDNEFIGWFVTQRYKCKTGGGYPAFGDDVFVFNKNMTECTFHMKTEEFEELCDFIDQLMEVPKDEVMKRIEDLDLLEQ